MGTHTDLKALSTPTDHATCCFWCRFGRWGDIWTRFAFDIKKNVMFCKLCGATFPCKNTKKTLFQYNKINMHIFSKPNNTNFLRSHTPIKWQTSQNYLESSLASCTWMRILHMSSSSWGFSYASITETAWMNTFPAKLKRLNLFQLLANLIIV